MKLVCDIKYNEIFLFLYINYILFIMNKVRALLGVKLEGLASVVRTADVAACLTKCDLIS